MRLRDAFSSPSTMDIIYSCSEGFDMRDKPKHNLEPATRRAYVDRSMQGAALSGYPNVPLDRNADSMVKSAPLTPIPASPLEARQAQKAQQTMTLTLKRLNKKGTAAIYAGALAPVRIGIRAFPDKQAPASIEVADGVFAVAAPKVKKVKLTKEERAALPKPTEAEKIKKMEERLARAKAKLAEADGGL